MQKIRLSARCNNLLIFNIIGGRKENAMIGGGDIYSYRANLREACGNAGLPSCERLPEGEIHARHDMNENSYRFSSTDRYVTVNGSTQLCSYPDVVEGTVVSQGGCEQLFDSVQTGQLMQEIGRVENEYRQNHTSSSCSVIGAGARWSSSFNWIRSMFGF